VVSTGVSVVRPTWRQVSLPLAAEHWEDTGQEGTPGSMRMLDHIQIMSVVYLIPWIQNRQAWLESGGTFYETTPERHSAFGSC
jgi:hypothetical protein